MDIGSFERLMRASLPDFAADALLYALSSPVSAVSVRNNPFKIVVPEVTCGGRQMEWCSGAFYLDSRKSFTQDPEFHSGAYYVQDSSSMFPALLEELLYDAVYSGNGNVLDLCASPGGKSTHLISLLNCLHPVNSSELSSLGDSSGLGLSEKLPLVVCNEAVGKRVPPLADNIAKWGASNVVVTGTSALNLGQLNGFFDVVLADVPCSGEGMFRKSADAVSGWRLSSVEECVALQRSIIEDMWPALREGGLLVYSTCTYNHLENGDNVKYIAECLGAEVVDVDKTISSTIGFAGRKGVVKLPFGYQFVPGLVNGEGQFFAVLRKQAASSIGAGRVQRGSKQKSPDQSIFRKIAGEIDIEYNTSASVGKYASNLEMDFFFEKSSGEVYMLYADKNLQERMLQVRQVLGSTAPSCVKMCGCRVGQIKAGKLVPDADLALNVALVGAETVQILIFASKADKHPVKLDFACIETDRQTALKFLAKETITPQPEWPRGYILLKYHSLGLGFVNNLGTRCNNLYPANRRIRQNI